MSNSAPDLQWFQGVIPPTNLSTGRRVEMAHYGADTSLTDMRAQLHSTLASTLNPKP